MRTRPLAPGLGSKTKFWDHFDTYDDPPSVGSKRLCVSQKEIPEQPEELPELPEDALKIIFPLTKGTTCVEGVNKHWNICGRQLHSDFFKAVPEMLGKHDYNVLCRSVFNNTNPTDTVSKTQMLILLVHKQRKRVENFLKSSARIKEFYTKKNPFNAQFFVSTEKWLADCNLALFATKITKIRHLALEALQDAPSVQPLVEKIRSHLSGDERQELDLADIGLTDLPPEISLFSDLTTLKLSHNNLWHPNHLEKLATLTVLDLSHNKIQENWELPENSGLKALSLKHNELTYIPKIVRQLPLLNTLSLSHNSLSRLNEIQSLVELKALYLKGNHLTKLTKKINTLKNLLHLDLSYNKLKSLPDLSSLQVLYNLNISNNKLERFPPIFDLRRLRFLDISGNKDLKQIPAELFKMPKLESLTLSRNQAKLLPESVPCNIKIVFKEDASFGMLSQSIGEVTENYDSEEDPSEVVDEESASDSFDSFSEVHDYYSKIIPLDDSDSFIFS